jgi:cell wall-associated NlpC family hydrolase
MGWATTPAQASPAALRAEIVRSADAFLEKLEVSYVYGGSKVGSPEDCDRCNACLEAKLPKPRQRFTACPVCQECSLDCSHFVHLVYADVGIKMPYLTSQTMIDLPKLDLSRRYGLIDLGTDIDLADAGDLLVYRGHVVLLAEKPQNGRGRIVHATGGRDIRLPGQGIQTERQAPLALYRGPLLRILRPKALMALPPKASKAQLLPKNP